MVVQTVLYGFLMLLLQIFHEDSLADTQNLYALAVSVSSEEDIGSIEMLKNQQRVLEILSYCLATMRKFSPNYNLRQLLLDQVCE